VALKLPFYFFSRPAVFIFMDDKTYPHPMRENHFCQAPYSLHASKPGYFFLFSIVVTLLCSCADKKQTQADYKKYIDTTVSVYGQFVAVKLPMTKGVSISNPVQISPGPDDVLYAANQSGEVYALRDTDHDGLEDMADLYCNVKDYGLRSPAGFAYKGDTIFIGAAQQIRAFRDIDKNGKADTSWMVFDQIPYSEHPYEWTTGLSFGPDGWLYFALASDSWNAAPSADPNGYRGAIVRVTPDGKKVERVATGIRSVYGMAFNKNGDLFFADNEGGGNPTEELNLLIRDGFYGHNKKKYKIDSALAPQFSFETEVAPSGIVFNTADNDFGGGNDNMFVAYYGPGERWTRGAVSRVEIVRSEDGNYSYHEIPLADIPKISDLAFGKDGNLYLASHGKADYWYNVVYENQGSFYKLIYDPSLPAMDEKTRERKNKTYSVNSIEAGKQLFAERACLGCHQVDGVTELLGPNLKDLGKRMSREEIMEEIMNPSERIKPGLMAIRITKKDGKVVMGRVVSADENQLALMVVGNHIVTINRSEIDRTEEVKESLMYKGLLNGMTDEQKNYLLDFLVSLSD